MEDLNLKDYRCQYCNKLFFKAAISNAIIEIKCRSCKKISLVKNEETEQE